ncbi:MAG: hypothetical protein R3A48_13055 [Polyangiales bacterium]
MTPLVRWSIVLCLGAASMGCRRRARPIVQPAARAPVTQAAAEPAPVEPADPYRLLPGNESAFGLRMPVRSAQRLQNPNMKMFMVEAPMHRVMAYLQERLRIETADIHPLAAMVRGAQVVEADVRLVVDVGVRDEGDRTLVTVWNRSVAQGAQGSAGNLEQGLRNAGIDPRTGRPLPQYNN